MTEDRAPYQLHKRNNPTVVEYLEELLARAKDGEITEFVAIYSALTPEGLPEYETCWVGVSDRFKVAGLLLRCAVRQTGLGADS